MRTILDRIFEKIAEQNPAHATKLQMNLEGLDAAYRDSANVFLGQYEAYLQRVGKTLDFGVGCYLHMVDDMFEQRMKFMRSGHYSNSSFAEVEKSVYGNPETMTYHMHGLVLAQFLWFDQYERILFFTQNLRKYCKRFDKYLEMGGGHGLYLYEAVKLLPEMQRFDMVDISQSSLDLAKGIIDNNAIHYYLKNIFDFREDEKYDFITLGEVLEHLEDPMQMLVKIGGMLSETGVSYITTPINAPMIDHIYLFNHVEEIWKMITDAGFEIIEEKLVISEKITPEKAQKLKVPVMFAAFIKKQK